MNAANPSSAQPSTNTCDLGDKYKNDTSGAFRALPPVFKNYGARMRFAGPVSTVRCLDDNSVVKAALEEPGAGRVLVVDGGGSLRCALLGDLIGASAVKHGWAGVIVYGCVRDVDALAELDLGIQAIAAMPLKSVRKGVGEVDLPVTFAGVTFNPGEYVYADNNGVIVSAQKLI